MVRIPPDQYALYLSEAPCKPANFTGRTMKGFVMAEPSGIDMDEALDK